MNVFVLCTGRCGSTTFIQASSHIKNYTSGHETLSGYIGNTRLAYPVNHIEADNRLSWLLGRLDAVYGNNAFYVHLQRDMFDVALSLSRRWDFGLMKAYRTAIIMRDDTDNIEINDRVAFAMDLYSTMTENIEYFLRDKDNKMNFYLENARNNWIEFCERIHADVDLEKSLQEWSVQYNKTEYI